MSDQNNPSSGMIEIALLIFIPLALALGLWYAFRPVVMWFSFYTSYFVFKFGYSHLSLLMSGNEYASLMRSIASIQTINPSKHGIEALYKLFTIHGYVMRWPFGLMMIYQGWKTRKGVVRFKYRRQIKNVYDLIEIQAEHFPASYLVKGKNILEHHLYEGPWRTYALPIDFALDHQMLWTHAKPNGPVLDPKAPVNEAEMVPIPPFDKDEKLFDFPKKRSMIPHHRYVALNLRRANQIFADQLGPIWKGAKALPPMERGLFAAFCAQAAGDAPAAMQLINQMGFSFVEATYDKKFKILTPHSCDTSGCDELIEKYEKHVDIQHAITLHAHSYNVIYAVLHLARLNGRLFLANFLWIRLVNRQLFILLESHGGQCGYWEVAGLWAHYQIEERMKKRQLRPAVGSAVVAMYDTMQKEHWVDPGEYSEDAQRRMVQAANKLVQEGVQEATGPKSSTGFVSQVKTSDVKAAKRREDQP